MDYVQMIKDPELVYGFQELIGDKDHVVVKRTIKVFTSVYYHALRLLATRELEEEVFLKAWSSVKGVVDTLMGMAAGCENEGVLIHVLRFTEAAVTSHLMYDLTPFPEVFEKGRDVVKNGLKSLKNVVTTPYIGGVAFIVGVRALITIACLRPDLWDPVTDLLKKQLSALPPTLFDHNVRSLHKILQRNLFRLLRRAETPALKTKLIEMMVSVGVSRKVVMPWAPVEEGTKKRPASDSRSEESITGRATTPPEKKRKTEESVDDKSSRRANSPSVPLQDPRICSKQPIQESNVISNVIATSTTNKPKPIKSDFMFLASLLPKAFNKEKEVYNVLTTERVVNLVLEGLDYLPDMAPKSFSEDFHKQAIVSEDVDAMRKHLAYMLTKDLTDKGLKQLIAEVKENKSTPTLMTTEKDNSVSKPKESTVVQMAAIKPQENSTSKCDSPQRSTPPMDTDLRQLYAKPLSTSTKDVDMRELSLTNPRIATARDSSSTFRDPKLSTDHLILKNESRLVLEDPRTTGRNTATSTTDPRLASSDPRLASSDPRLASSDPRLASSDPRLASSDPRLASSDPRLASSDSRLASSDPRLASSDPRLVSSDRRLASNDPRLSSSSARSSIIDSRTASNDPRSTSNDSKPNFKDPRLISNDPRSISNDPRSISNDPRSISNDPRSISNDSNPIFKDPRLAVTDPRTVSNDPRSILNNSRSTSNDIRLKDGDSQSNSVIRDPRLRKEDETNVNEDSNNGTSHRSSKGPRKSRWDPDPNSSENMKSDPRMKKSFPSTDVSRSLTMTSHSNVGDHHFRCPPPSVGRDPRFRPNFNGPPPFNAMNGMSFPLQRHRGAGQTMRMAHPYGGWPQNGPNYQGSQQSQRPSNALLPTPMINM